MSYGWLHPAVLSGGSWHGWWGSSAKVGVTLYEYGWPSGGTSESNVAEQWLFDEGSGNLTGEANSTVVTVSGTPTYSVALSGQFANLTPGITFASSGFFDKAGNDVNFDLDLDDFVFEYWFNTSSAAGTNWIFSTVDTASNDRGYAFNINRTGNNFGIWIRGTDDATVNANFSPAVSGTDLDDGNWHKVRIAGDRSGSAQLYVDGTAEGTASLAAVAASNAKGSHVGVGTYDGSTASLSGVTLAELRITIGNATNNSGGPGGG